jgi:dipeptidyl-peptidase III
MKKNIIILSIFIFANIFANTPSNYLLEKPSEKIDTYLEIAVKYDDKIPGIYNTLSKEEKIVAYYLYRAGIPGNEILSSQLHYSANTLKGVFERICYYNITDQKNFSDFLDKCGFDKNFDKEKFLSQVKTYLVYLWTNHSQYFAREFVNHKRSPKRLKLDMLTRGNFEKLFKFTFKPNEKKLLEMALDDLDKNLFDEKFQPTLTVPGSINKSAIGIYADNFTDADFEKLSKGDKKTLNANFYKVKNFEKNKEIDFYIEKGVYKIDDIYSEELKICYHWLEKAYLFAKDNPKTFDYHFTSSLKYLLLFIQTGNEDVFKQHSIEWLQSNSKIDYVFGFIEVYKDPKAYRGFFEADVTIKTVDMEKFKSIILNIEENLPFKSEYKRDPKIATLPNVSINKAIFASGDLGPMQTVAAYCLPNYGDIRSSYGSKQIVYEQNSKSIGKSLSPKLAKELFYLSDEITWHDKFDSDYKLNTEIWNLQVLLHETIGHGSGRASFHVTKDNKKIDVTSDNIQTLLSPHFQTLEELRAEILALYVGVEYYDELVRIGNFENFSKTVSKEKMQEELIKHMAMGGLNRLIAGQEDSDVVSGDHARADFTILNYLLNGRSIEIVEEIKEINNEKFVVYGIKVNNLEKAKKDVLDLAVLVQEIKSTGNGDACKDLIETYGMKIKNKDIVKNLKKNRKAVVGKIMAVANIYPDFIPIKDPKTKELVDIKAVWPKDIFEQQLKYSKLTYSKELE